MDDIVLGIISFFPEKIASARQEAFSDLLDNITKIFGKSNIIVIAQNWGEYQIDQEMQETHNIQVFYYNELGIIKARQTLGEKFLESEFNYLVMLDDDCVIKKCVPDGGQKFLEEIKKHPNGFSVIRDQDGKYKRAQLNLFTIAKTLYRKDPILDIDPQKNEGWEDEIYTNYLHYKYPKQEFSMNFLTHIQFRNPQLDTPSTWEKSGNKDNDTLLNNTKYAVTQFKQQNFDLKEIKAEFAQAFNGKGLVKTQVMHCESGESIPFDVDYVFPYVNNREVGWLKSYVDYCNKYNIKPEVHGQRFSDNFGLAIVVESIKKALPWVRKIHIIVSNTHQIPRTLRSDPRINIITHRKIIPQAFLPTFNSTTIEMFLANIPDLAEHFIYANDDMFPIKRKDILDFFTEDGKVRVNIIKTKYNDEDHLYQNVSLNNVKTLCQCCKFKYKDQNKFCHWTDHGLTPMLRSTCIKVMDKCFKNILPNISAFRTKKQHNQFIYPMFEQLRGMRQDSNVKTAYITFNSILKKLIKQIETTECDVVCINDLGTYRNAILSDRDNVEMILDALRDRINQIS